MKRANKPLICKLLLLFDLKCVRGVLCFFFVTRNKTRFKCREQNEMKNEEKYETFTSSFLSPHYSSERDKLQIKHVILK